MNQRERIRSEVFKVSSTTCSNDFSSITNPSKLIESTISFLYRDLDVVDGMIRQMENVCAQRGAQIISGEAGHGELQRCVDWVQNHFMERASGK
jgi:hypothetical protein